MKKLFPLLFLFASLGNAQTQGTLEFTAHLTSPLTDFTGDGGFSLTGDLFTYNLYVLPFNFDHGEIHGPGPAPNAPLLFDLKLTRCDTPYGPYLGGCWYAGNFTLSNNQITELENELWYVRAYSPEVPQFVLQGQLIAVPEPSVLSLIAVGIGLGYLYARWKVEKRFLG